MLDTLFFKDATGNEVRVTRNLDNIPLYRLRYPKLEEEGIWNPEENYTNVTHMKLITYLIGGMDAYNSFVEWNDMWVKRYGK